MFVAKRILIITNETKFALNVKKALERNGEITVSIFSSGKTGIDYARSHPQDVAVVDFRMKDMPGTDMVDHLRTLQHDIAIIAAPNHKAIHDLQDRYNIQRIVNIPMSIRKFVASLNTAKKDVIDKQQITDAPSNPLIEGLSVERSPQTIEFWLAENENGETVIDSEPITEPDLSPESSATFQRLAAEEPPMPTMSEGSTIRDLRERLTNLDEIKRILATAAEEETEPVISREDSQAIPAAIILEAALDESKPIYAFSLDEFMKRTNDSNSDISPLPSWQREDGRYVTEPDFLPDELSFPELDEAIEYTGTVTIQTTPPFVERQDATDWVTDTLEPIQRSHPIEEETPTQAQAQESDAQPLDDTEVAEHIADLGRPAPPLPPELPDIAVSTVSDEKLPYIDFDDDDSQLAQLATTLTQVALELTADATVLARDGKIVGYAGRLPMSDLEGLLDQLTVEWDKTNESNKSRILFAEIPETGAEFMISTRGTAVGFTLSLIFSGTRPLHDIRRQSKRLVDALSTLPEPDPVVEVESVTQSSEPIEIVDDIDRTPIAYLWLQRDSNMMLDNALQSQIVKTLDSTLSQSNWKIENIEASDYVYIYGEMPEALNPRDILTDLMQRSAQSINADTQQLWDDSYLILQPGRAMQTEEIQRFINFARR